MRPGQNKRLRGRNNNGRKGPNPLTRSFESNGPDVKIRGTAQHVAEKYLQLARDAQTSGDIVMAENLLQHAEHYFRLIAAAQQQSTNAYGRQSFEAENDVEDDDDDFTGIPDRFAPLAERLPPAPPAFQPPPTYSVRSRKCSRISRSRSPSKNGPSPSNRATSVRIARSGRRSADVPIATRIAADRTEARIVGTTTISSAAARRTSAVLAWGLSATATVTDSSRGPSRLPGEQPPLPISPAPWDCPLSSPRLQRSPSPRDRRQRPKPRRRRKSGAGRRNRRARNSTSHRVGGAGRVRPATRPARTTRPVRPRRANCLSGTEPTLKRPRRQARCGRSPRRGRRRRNRYGRNFCAASGRGPCRAGPCPARRPSRFLCISPKSAV